jgi:hypothetical protein
VGAFDELLARLTADHFSGWDPYDALSSPLLGRLAYTAVLRRASVQMLKRSPVNLRRLLLVARQPHTKGLALAVSACAAFARSRFGRDEAATAVGLARPLADRAIRVEPGIGWGYDFDVQTRWGHYRRGEPNAVATAFCGHALLDAAALTEQDDLREAARAAVAFCCSALLVDRDGECYFAYHPAGRIPIHNANMLVAGFVARAGDEAAVSVAQRAVDFTVARQRRDGSWPYGERAGLEWVDGFHTAYVLDDLRRWYAATGAKPVQNALERGLSFYLGHLIDSDGAARALPESRHPVDIHGCATAITVLSRLRRFDVRALPTASHVLDWTLGHMRRRDGHFAFQQHRWWRNNVSYVRWSDAHMLLALATFAEALDDS